MWYTACCVINFYNIASLEDAKKWLENDGKDSVAMQPLDGKWT
jgi:hypothetical protein